MLKTRVNPLISIIIPAYNAEKIIPKCLQSIHLQTIFRNTKNLNITYHQVEIILVDDRSTDHTSQKAKLISQKLKLNLKIIPLKKHEERGIARNTGSNRATGKYLLFLDADMQLSEKVLEDCINAVNNGFKAVIIPEHSYGEGYWAKCRSLEKKCYIGNDHIEAARFIEKTAFLKVGGWDPSMISGEDWDLTRRLREKYQITRITSLIYHNEGHLTLWSTAKKKYYYGTVSLPFWQKNLVKSSYIFSIVFRPAYFKQWRLLLLDPIHTIGMVILKFVEFSALALGVLRSRIFRPPQSF